MPIYVYRCSRCGHQQDVLQKMSDPRLTHCPACGHETYEKQVTAAGFRLKGTGWYETDFRGGGSHASHASGVSSPSTGNTAAQSSSASSASSSTATPG
ncbi:hypothetical protein CDEF62S_05433 [Castellaniella defragrans]